MAQCNCTARGNQHDNGLPEGAWVYWSGRIPVIVQKDERIVVEPASSDVDLVWLIKPDGTALAISRVYKSAP